MFRFGNEALELGKKTYIMGILNFTPDSFSDGGKYFDTGSLVSHALEMQALGADIIDLGANSTRPGCVPLTESEEMSRLEQALKALKNKLSVPLSVDTFYPECAEMSLEYGAVIINDVSGNFSDSIAEKAAKANAGYIVTHNREVKADKAVEKIREFFLECIDKASVCGLGRQALCLDPGFGFGKDTDANIEILKNLNWLKFKDTALLAGVSRKRFIGSLSEEPDASSRDFGTNAANLIAIENGADIIRVHNVKAAKQTALVADKLLRG